jgi:SAM-dependent methyltransferase
VHGPAPKVAGVPIELGTLAGRLHQCPDCGLQFKQPFIPGERLMACYRASPGDNWEHDPDPRRRRFDLIAGRLRHHLRGPRVLDVGCSNGALLASILGGGDAAASSIEAFGLEPSVAAAAVAEARGVRMLGGTFEDLPPEVRFDGILAIDVLEHLTDPSAFVGAAARHLSPGGVFLALTGDHEAWGWRLQGAAYWYAALPEHQVFYARSTMRHLAEAHGLELVHAERLSHARHRPGRIVRDAIRGTVFGGLRRLGVQRRTPGPGWLPARDHMLVVLRRPAAAD